MDCTASKNRHCWKILCVTACACFYVICFDFVYADRNWKGSVRTVGKHEEHWINVTENDRIRGDHFSPFKRRSARLHIPTVFESAYKISDNRARSVCVCWDPRFTSYFPHCLQWRTNVALNSNQSRSLFLFPEQEEKGISTLFKGSQIHYPLFLFIFSDFMTTEPQFFKSIYSIFTAWAIA